ncbi:sigma factor-like helix-turn-helix DNA-binding protein [Streptomyces sp. NBC_01538]|uniref:sigma factor-like helix-turn-helix DNA-binding protein n=1 Tax=Streptomyces sp. NBC_01538 TaxID=2903897 RepID=UPI00386F74EE
MILVDLEGLSHDDAGERLGTHRGSVQRNRTRARAKLRAHLTAPAANTAGAVGAVAAGRPPRRSEPM